MYQFLESICCVNGKIKNLLLHQNRVNRTYLNYFKTEPISLSKALIEIPKIGKYKCRVVYSSQIDSIEFLPYNLPSICSLKVIENDSIDYTYKFLDRKNLENVFNQREKFDDIIISQNGLVTDSYYANLAFYDGKNWCTPTNPLLKGTKREFLLNSNLIQEKDIKISEIRQYQKVSLINALLDLSEIEVEIQSIDCKL